MSTLARPACARRGVDPELFFPEGYTSAHTRQIDAARALCAACPARTACLADAMRAEAGKPHPFRHGIRGGLTPTERTALSKARHAAARAAVMAR